MVSNKLFIAVIFTSTSLLLFSTVSINITFQQSLTYIEQVGSDNPSVCRISSKLKYNYFGVFADNKFIGFMILNTGYNINDTFICYTTNKFHIEPYWMNYNIKNLEYDRRMFIFDYVFILLLDIILVSIYAISAHDSLFPTLQGSTTLS
jgi:hypothetical protein